MAKNDDGLVAGIILGAIGLLILADALSKKKCKNCGWENPKENKVCANCGAGLD